ncbi:FHA domain-containing protein PS1-like [Gastrolobium bilobum]|uniref:FHA domain-containing protein PS1-like n=1 Tax=Gastrolobium bilobum TaxID=150636 RepID=UPI002AB2CAF6|nr:FHA domain-containing protein PS1-like [Gastrolobium bilobum]
MAGIAMADKNNNNPEEEEEEEEEERIPVLTVLKNNAIIKNIFIINNNKKEDTIVVGRHPDCNIVLTHPSVSRFHLKIRSAPSSRTLSLLDLSSVHGTWVCGRKLEPGVSVDLKEGDTFTVGVSTRLYRLRWDENFELKVEKEIPMPEDIISFCCDEERKSQSKDETFGVLNGSFGTATSHFPTNSDSENKQSGCGFLGLSPPYVQSVDEVDNKPKIEACPEVEMPGETNLFCTLREYLTQNICLAVVEAVQGTKMEKFQGPPASFDENGAAAGAVIPKESEFGCTVKDNDKIEDLLTGARILNTENLCLLVGEDIPDSKFHQIKIVEDSSVVIPKESEFGCTVKDNDKIEDLLTGARILNTENLCLLVGEDIPDSKFHQIKIVEDSSVNLCLLVGEDIPDSKFHQIKIVEDSSVDALSDGEKQDKCSEEYKSKLHDLNAKSCNEQGYSLDEIVEDIGNKCIKNMDPASFDENGAGAATDIPKESEFGCTLRDNDRIEDILTSEGRMVNSENTSLLDEEAVPETKFQQVKIVSEVAVDSKSDDEKQDKRGKELESELQANLNAKSCHEQGNTLDEIVEDTRNKCASSICPISFRVESLNSSTSQESVLNITNEKENQTMQSLIAVAGCSETVILESHVEATEKAKSCHEQGHSPDEIVQDIGNECTGSTCPILLQVESVNSSVPQESVLDITKEIENQTPQSLIAVTGCSETEIIESRVEAKEKSSTSGNNLSRRGKAASAPQVRTRKSRFMSTSNADTEVEMGAVRDIINKSTTKDLFSFLDGKEDIFAPNKENFSPNTLHLRFMRKKGKLEEIKHSKSQWSHNSKANFSPGIYPAESLIASNRVNKTPKVAQELKPQRKPLQCHTNLAHEQDIMELKKNRVERVPFQSLMNSGGNCKSKTSGPVSAAKSIDDANNCGQISDNRTKPSHIIGEQKRSWDMVVDTASLLNKESRKALQLLQGLKGTRLIIPSLVLRELGNMKQQFRIFRRTSEASLALEWIEECMENTKWWIHIQCSKEECMLIEESWAFPGPKSSKEFASRTVEDHILECALQHRRKENVGQLVLLSDDVTLKIKSMAKGLLCETVQRFRQSLVNPFSERFMWVNSSPRGLTWSFQDDAVLREKYCGMPAKAGLKLIPQQFLYFHV